MDFEKDITPLRGYCWMVYDRAGEEVELLYSRTEECPPLPEGYAAELVNGGNCVLNADVGGMVNVKVGQVNGLGTVIKTFEPGATQRLIDAVKAVLKQQEHAA
jgi:hypothetical protein